MPLWPSSKQACPYNLPRLLTFPNDTLPPELDAQVLAMLRAEYPAIVTSAAPRSLNDPRTNPTLLLLVEDAIVLSYLAIPSQTIHHAGQVYKARGLSSVITHPSHRHHGHGGQIVTAARDLIASSDADIGIFTCDPPLVGFYQACGWIVMPSTVVVGGTRDNPFPADSLGKCTMMGFFSSGASGRQTDFQNSAVYLDLRPGDLW